MKDDGLYVIHIRECIDKIYKYLNEDPTLFLESDVVQDAVIRNLQIMAESTQRLSDRVKAMSPDTDWHGLAGFRNVLVHEYLGVDVRRVFDFLATKLPALYSEINRISDILGLPDSPTK